MIRRSKFPAVLVSVIILVLALPVTGQADGGPHRYWTYTGSPLPYHGPYYPRYYPRYYPQYYAPYYPGYSCYNCSQDGHHDNHNNYKLWLGILGGGIAGYALNNVYHNGVASAPTPPTVIQYPNTEPVSPCLQQREYRTKVMVGSRQVDAYGTACLQPDGSWRYAPSQAGSY
jgi:hypothetical protein